MEPKVRFGSRATAKLLSLCKVGEAVWNYLTLLFSRRFGWRSLSEYNSSKPCSPCQKSFAVLEADNSGRRALLLDEAHPNCVCQLGSISPHSPGVVADEEVLIRILVAPQHMQGKKQLPRASALTDAERNGLSVFRHDFAADEKIRSVARTLVEKALKSNKNAGVFGVMLLNTMTLRTFQSVTEDRPCYCVYDTALADNQSHSEIFQRVFETDDSLREERRRGLYNLIKASFVPVAEFRDGLLLDLAPKSNAV